MITTRLPAVVFSFFAIICFAGCEKSPPPTQPRTNTGAEKVAKTFFDAIVHEDWAAAYETLDSESRAWCPKDHFSKLGQDFRSQIEFTPTDATVDVTEKDDRATAVATFRGVSGTEMKSFRDGTPLLRTSNGWAVVLRKNFGKKTALALVPPAAGKAGKE